MINSKEEIIKFVANNKFQKVFLMYGKKSFKNSGIDKFLEPLLKNKDLKYFIKNNDFPILNEVVNIINEIQKFKPDLILAVGGGAIIDYAKIANTVENKDNLEKMIIEYSYPFQKKICKLAVIPTTAGSGAEVTSNAVIYIDKIKYSFESEKLKPDFFFLIPDFLVSAPFSVKASAGFDAIAQALESLMSRKSNLDSVKFASDSLKISFVNFKLFLDKPAIKNASQMSIASNLAGKAINISKTTAPHAISYPFTSLFNLSHGHAVSLFFEKFLRFNYENISNSDVNFDLNERFQLIFNIFKVKDIDQFCNKVREIKMSAKLNDDLKKLNINLKYEIENILDGVNTLRLSNNPIKLDKDMIKKILLS